MCPFASSSTCAWPGTVAALAAERGGRRARILGLPVPRVRDALFLRLVTEHAGVGAGVARRQVGGRCLGRRCLGRRSLGGRCRRGSCPRRWLLRIDQATGRHADPHDPRDQSEPEEKRIPIHASRTPQVPYPPSGANSCRNPLAFRDFAASRHGDRLRYSVTAPTYRDRARAVSRSNRDRDQRTSPGTRGMLLALGVASRKEPPWKNGTDPPASRSIAGTG